MTAPNSPTNITVCMGSSCFSRGNNHNIEIIQEFLARNHIEAVVELAGHLCKGECKGGPNIMINGKTYHEADPVSVIGLLNYHFPQGQPWTA